MNEPSRPAPKQARAIATRRKLLEAAAASLCEVGCRGTTTTEVAQRAGVSQGALYKHFGNKQNLMAATTEYLFQHLIEAFRTAFQPAQGQPDPLPIALSALWMVFLKPELYAVVELYIASRTDEPLRQALLPVLLEHQDNLLEEAKRLFPEAAVHNPRFNLAVGGLMAALQGAAMNAAVLGDLSNAGEFAGFVEEICRRELEPPYGVYP